MNFYYFLILPYTIFYVQRLEIIVFNNLSKRLKNKLYYYYYYLHKPGL